MAYKEVPFETLKGKTIKSIKGAKEGYEEVEFDCEDGSKFIMLHHSSCCESVSIEDVGGDIKDVLGSPILLAEEVTSNENPEGVVKEYQDSFTWTFYKLATIKGSVTIRWYGESNGYYSESVDFEQVLK